MNRSIEMNKTVNRNKKSVSLGLALVLVFLIPTQASADKMGAGLRILKKDGALVEGELISVKGRIFTVAGSSRVYVSVRFDDVGQIAIIRKKPKVLKGALWGLLGGAVLGGILSPPAQCRTSCMVPQSVTGTAIGALAGVLIGVAVGSAVTEDEKFVVADMNPKMQDELLTKLRSESRYPDYQ